MLLLWVITSAVGTVIPTLVNTTMLEHNCVARSNRPCRPSLVQFSRAPASAISSRSNDSIGFCSRYTDEATSQLVTWSTRYKRAHNKATSRNFLWSSHVIGQTIIFLPCGFFLLLSSIFLFFLT